jgi:signal peptide peptidase SppA
MSHHLSRVLQFALAQTWALEKGFHQRLFEVLVRHAEGVKLTEDEISAATGQDEPQVASQMRVEKGVAVIPINGVIAHRAAAVGRISSNVGTSVEHVRADLQAALSNEAVTSILLDIDSPGGSVAGIAELAEEIREARARKPIVAHTEGMMASAAYWLGSQADKVFATRSSQVGSIGIIASFLDNHRALADRGLDPIVVKSTPAKGGVQGNGTFSDADRADVQREVDQFHAMFVEAVATGRGVALDKANAMADGRVYTGSEGLARGYVDGLSTRAAAIKGVRKLGTERRAAAIHSEPAGNVAAGDLNEEVPMTETKTTTIAATDQKPANPTPHVAEPAPKPTPDPVTAERERVAAIMDAAEPVQQPLAAKLCADGTPALEAVRQLTADRRSRSTPPASPSLAGGNTAQVANTSPDNAIAAMPEGEDKWKAEFAASTELQEEFRGDVGLYIGCMRNEQRIAKNKGRA